MRKLTIGMATHNDYDGLYFTIQSLRMYHSEIMKDVEFVIIDNYPKSEHGKANRKLTDWIQEPFQYLPFTKYESTTIKNKVFELSDTPYTMCLDSHVMVDSGALKKLIKFYDDGKDGGNLLQGPIVYDDLKNISTHFNDKWGSYMWGSWETDNRAKNKNAKPFEIPAQGMGLFSCRTDSWLGFNKHFRGFGGEEKYIHEKYKKQGKKTLCLPFLRWMHRFDRPNAPIYSNDLKDRYRNYLIGFTELEIDQVKNLKEVFCGAISKKEMEIIDKEVENLFKDSPSYVQR